MGWILKIIIENNLFMVELFKLIRIGVASTKTEAGLAKAIIFGIWKFEINITFAIRNKINFHEIGEA